MNDNGKPTRGKHDDFARSLFPEKTLAMIDGLPALLKNDTLDTLKRELVEAQVNLDRINKSIDGYVKLGHNMRTTELTHTAFRSEYLARMTLHAYALEILVREAEARVGIHH